MVGKRSGVALSRIWSLRPFWILAFVTISLLMGCSDGPNKYTVTGDVTFNGSSVKKGEITFAPEGGAGRPDSCLIADGKYQLSVTQGKKLVRISAWSTDPQLVGPPPRDMPIGGINPDREYIPARYNESSTLSIEVLPKSGQNFDFQLEK